MKPLPPAMTAAGPVAPGAVEDDVRDLIRREIAPALKPIVSASARPPQPPQPAPTQQASPPLAPATHHPGSLTIDAIDRLIAELQETRDYLRDEGDRLARATERYEKMSQNAAASVEIISDTVQRWRRTGFS